MAGTNDVSTLPWQFSPELLELLVDTLTKLNSSKRQLLTWLRSAGVPDQMLAPWLERLATNPNDVKKPIVTRDVLCRLNEGGDKYLRQRREILKRVTETEDFSACWEDDRLAAKGLVSAVRESINKRDSFTRMNIEREAQLKRQRDIRNQEAVVAQERRKRLELVRQDVGKLFLEADTKKRGRDFDGILTRLFEASGIEAAEPFRLRDEQIDGAVYFDGHVYLVEAKWWNCRLDTPMLPTSL